MSARGGVIVLLDASPLGRVTNPHAGPTNAQCQAWLAGLLADGATRGWVPEIADYEVRREVLRGGSPAGLTRLDDAGARLGFIPITRPAMRRAAELWASARRQGQPTAGDAALDADVILAAQAVVLAAREAERVVVATENARHLARCTEAADWRAWASVTP